MRRSTLTPPKLARYWAVSADKVLALIKSGELEAFNVATNRFGRPRYRISQDAIAAFEKRRAANQAPPINRRHAQHDANVIEFF